MPGCPFVACCPPGPPLPTTHSCTFQASPPASPLTLLCVSMFLVSLFFFLKQRNVSLKGSLLPSGTLASGHPLRSLECAREGQSPLPLWPGPCGPTLLVSAATTPTGPWGPQLGALPLKEGRHGSAGHLSPQGWQDRIPGLRPGNSASGKPPPRVSLHDPSSHRGCEPVGLRLSFSTLKTVTILKVAAAANTPIKLATGQALYFAPGVR